MRTSTLTLQAAVVVFANLVAASPTSIKRDSDKIICNIQNFQRESRDTILDSQVSALGSSGSITLGNQAGGGWCSRLACGSGLNGDVGIYACNDAAVNVTIAGSSVADLAEAIMNTDGCLSTKRVGRQTWHYVQGQAFNYTGGWNVILGMEDGESC